jgi:hypothetical protein
MDPGVVRLGAAVAMGPAGRPRMLAVENLRFARGDSSNPDTSTVSLFLGGECLIDVVSWQVAGAGDTWALVEAGTTQVALRGRDSVRLRSLTLNLRLTGNAPVPLQLSVAGADTLKGLSPALHEGSVSTYVPADSGSVAVNSNHRPQPFRFSLPTQFEASGQLRTTFVADTGSIQSEIAGPATSARYASLPTSSPTDDRATAVEMLPTSLEVWRDRSLALAAIVVLVTTLARFLMEFWFRDRSGS